jgi:ankyrin repeat protein
VESNPVNVHVRDFSTVNFLIKAQDVANDTNPVKKLLTQEERTERAIKATTYLLSKGVDINYRDKSGGTALQAAVHWESYDVA